MPFTGTGYRRGRLVALALCAAASGAVGGDALAQSLEDRVRLLEATIQDLLQRDAEKEALIRKMREQAAGTTYGAPRPAEVQPVARQHDHQEPGHSHGLGDARVPAHGEAGRDLYAADVGGATAFIRRIGVDIAAAAGYSSEKQEILEQLQAGDHDPRQNGFTLQTADLSVTGGVAPYFDAALNVAFVLDPEGETKVELEEAYLETRPFWGGVQVKAGQFFTNFGAFNPQHVHDWDWQDQPIIANRMFGPDGLRNPGVQVSWTPPTPWRAKLSISAQNAQGETAVSFRSSDEAFGERPIGGRSFNADDVDDLSELLWGARLQNHLPLGSGAMLTLGASALVGPNATGTEGETRIYGADLSWHQALAGGRALTWRTEVMKRDYEAAADAPNGLAADTLEDYGLYTQLTFDFDSKWAAGLRYEFATGDGDSVATFADRIADPFRSDRHRVSPMVAWSFAPNAKARLQYNYDNARHLAVNSDNDNEAHAVWLGLLWSIGAGGSGHAHGAVDAAHPH